MPSQYIGEGYNGIIHITALKSKFALKEGIEDYVLVQDISIISLILMHMFIGIIDASIVKCVF